MSHLKVKQSPPVVNTHNRYMVNPTNTTQDITYYPEWSNWHQSSCGTTEISTRSQQDTTCILEILESIVEPGLVLLLQSQTKESVFLGDMKQQLTDNADIILPEGVSPSNTDFNKINQLLI